MTAPGMATVLVCDDEAPLREMVGEYLGERGYDVLEAGTADEMRALLAGHRPDLIVLDIQMPKEDGLSALRWLRQETDLPVIMLTASAGTLDRVAGLELGADDYIGKPVDLRELDARIKAVLRRGRLSPGAQPAHEARVAFGDCMLDLETARLFGIDGAEIPITAMEFALLRHFALNPGKVMTRDEILAGAHDRNWDPEDRSLDLRISRLRRKVEVNPNRPTVIRTVRGVGYVFS